MDTKVKSDGNPRHSSGTDELGVAEKGGRSVVVAVEESCSMVSKMLVREFVQGARHNILRGFFFKKRKTVSSSSRYLVR